MLHDMSYTSLTLVYCLNNDLIENIEIHNTIMPLLSTPRGIIP